MDKLYITEHFARNDAAKSKETAKNFVHKTKDEQKFAVDGVGWSTASSIWQRKTDTFYIETEKSPQTRKICPWRFCFAI